MIAMTVIFDYTCDLCGRFVSDNYNVLEGAVLPKANPESKGMIYQRNTKGDYMLLCKEHILKEGNDGEKKGRKKTSKKARSQG